MTEDDNLFIPIICFIIIITIKKANMDGWVLLLLGKRTKHDINQERAAEG
jgi:hypothetical protein